jgi:RNA polymerase sigma-70 factor, ECF subfamily
MAGFRLSFSVAGNKLRPPGLLRTEVRNMADRGESLDIGQLVADFHQPLYRYAYRLSGSVSDAEDLTQQVFLIAQQKIHQVRDSECRRGWLFTVLRNCYSKSFRGRLPTVGLEFDIDAVPAAIADTTVDTEQLQLALNALSDEFKIVVLMFYFEQRSYREIAALLEIPLGTVMSRLARGKSHLRRLLSDAEARHGARVGSGKQNDGREQKGSGELKGPTEPDWYRPAAVRG